MRDKLRFQNDKPPAPGRGLREEKLASRRTGLPAASGHFEIFSRCFAAVGHELVLESLTVVERAETSALHCRDMDEDVLVAGRRPDEPVAFSGIEPFDGALLHRLSPGKSV